MHIAKPTGIQHENMVRILPQRSDLKQLYLIINYLKAVPVLFMLC